MSEGPFESGKWGSSDPTLIIPGELEGTVEDGPFDNSAQVPQDTAEQGSSTQPLVFVPDRPRRLNKAGWIVLGTTAAGAVIGLVSIFNYQPLGYKDPRQGVPEPRPSITQPIHTASATQTPESTNGSVQVTDSPTPSLPPEIVLPASEAPSEPSKPTPSKTLPEITTPAAEPTPTETQQSPTSSPMPTETTPTSTTPSAEPTPTPTPSPSTPETTPSPSELGSIGTITLRNANPEQIKQRLDSAQSAVVVVRNSDRYSDAISSSTNCEACRYAASSADTNTDDRRILWNKQAYSSGEQNFNTMPLLDGSGRKVGYSITKLERGDGGGAQAIIDTQLPKKINEFFSGVNQINYNIYVDRLAGSARELQQSAKSVAILFDNDYNRLSLDQKSQIDTKLTSELGFAKITTKVGTSFAWKRP